MHRTQHIALWATVALAMAVVGMEVTERITLHTTREWRQRFAVKAMDSRVPIEVIEVINDDSQFDLDQVLALIWCESRGNPRAVSPDGNHVGLMGVKLIYAKKYGVSEEDLFDPIINVTIGLDILREKAKRYKNVEYHYVSGYNCKDSTMKEFLEKGTKLPVETRKHWRRYRKVKRRYVALLRHGFWSDAPLPR